MTEKEHKNLLLLDLKASSSNLQRKFSRVRNEPLNNFEVSAIHLSLKYQFQLEEKTIKELGMELSQSHNDEHAIILEKTMKLQGQWEQKLISDGAYADIVMGLFIGHKFRYDDVLIDSIQANV